MFVLRSIQNTSIHRVGRTYHFWTFILVVHIVPNRFRRFQPTSCLSPNPLSTIFCTPESSTHVKKPNWPALTPHGCATFPYDGPRHSLRAGSLAASVTIKTSGTPDLTYFETFTVRIQFTDVVADRVSQPRGPHATRELRVGIHDVNH